MDKDNCGICDYCLSIKKNKIDANTFTSIEKQLFVLLSKTPTPMGSIFVALAKEDKEAVWEVIHFLEAENRLIMNEDGTIQLV
jgi:hypothetical protein